MARRTFTYDGKRYDVKANSEEELGAKIAMKKRDLEEGKITVSPNTTVKDWGNKWLDTYIKESVELKTSKDYQARLDNFIFPQIGKMKIKDVKPIHCQDILYGMKGYSKDRILKVRNTMFQMFKKAQKNNLIMLNPADDLALPKAKDGKGRALTEHELELLLKVCETHRGGLWALTMLYCGLRPGETKRVLGAHIDYKKKRIYIDGTKSEAAKRYVPLPDELIDQFKSQNKSPYEHVFTGEKRQPLSDSAITKLWKNIWREMNILAGTRVYRNELIPPYKIAEDCTAYCCRHAFATDCKDALLPYLIIKSLMGHASKSDVTDTYMHSTDKSLDIAAKMLAEYRKKDTDVESGVDAKQQTVEI